MTKFKIRILLSTFYQNKLTLCTHKSCVNVFLEVSNEKNTIASRSRYTNQSLPLCLVGQRMDLLKIQPAPVGITIPAGV